MYWFVLICIDLYWIFGMYWYVWYVLVTGLYLHVSVFICNDVYCM